MKMNVRANFMSACAPIVTGVALLALPTAASANMLTNPGFEIEDMSGGTEDGLTGPEAAADWVQFRDTSPPPGTAFRNDDMPHTGQWDLLLQTESDTSGFTGAYEEVAASPGESFVFSVWAKVDDLADGIPGIDDSGSPTSEARFRIEWHSTALGGGSGEISRIESNITSMLTDTYQLFSISGVAPAGAQKLRAVLALNNNDDKFYFDDASVVVPEPASLTLSATALLGIALLWGRRRRK